MFLDGKEQTGAKACAREMYPVMLQCTTLNKLRNICKAMAKGRHYIANVCVVLVEAIPTN